MASPPEMSGDSVPAIPSMRTALPFFFATAMTCCSLAPVTVSSTETTTVLLAESTDHAVPAMRAEFSRSAVADASWASVAAGAASAAVGAVRIMPATSPAAARAVAAGRTDLMSPIRTSMSGELGPVGRRVLAGRTSKVSREFDVRYLRILRDAEQSGKRKLCQSMITPSPNGVLAQGFWLFSSHVDGGAITGLLWPHGHPY